MERHLMRIDMFAHGVSSALRARVLNLHPNDPVLINWHRIPALSDLTIRSQLMDEAQIDIQVITAPSPPLEHLFGGNPDQLRRIVRLANDSMSEMVHSSSGRLRGTVTVPLCEPEFAAAELRRGVKDLNLLGPQIFTSSRGVPLDDPRLDIFWRELEALGAPAWIHPERTAETGDYPGEQLSRFGLYMVLGWPYETSVALMRLVLSGVLTRYPGLKFIVHHAGGMIPFFAARIDSFYPPDEVIGRIEPPLISGPPTEALRRLYVDTAIHGPLSALMCAYDFFGPSNMVIGTDSPFGPRDGREYTLRGSNIVDAMQVDLQVRDMIRFRNALRLGIDVE